MKYEIGSGALVMRVDIARTPTDVRACFPVMKQLRPHLDEDGFMRRLKTMEEEGYQLAVAKVDGRVAGVGGYRIFNMLFQTPSGRCLYVDDLVTDDAQRSTGVGKALLDWLIAEAKRLDCDALELDSGVQRVAAHRFYLNQRMHISSYHFRIPLKAAPPKVLFAAPFSKPSTT